MDKCNQTRGGCFARATEKIQFSRTRNPRVLAEDPKDQVHKKGRLLFYGPSFSGIQSKNQALGVNRNRFFSKWLDFNNRAR